MLRRLLKDEALVGRDDAFHIVRSLPHGHVAAVLGTLKLITRPTPLQAKALELLGVRLDCSQ